MCIDRDHTKFTEVRRRCVKEAVIQYLFYSEKSETWSRLKI